jgi:type IV secretion system protein VirD4
MNDQRTPMPFGSASFATRAQCVEHGLMTDSPLAIPFGQLVENGAFTMKRTDAVGYDGERHALLFGANGSGKSLRVLANLLLNSTSQRSFIVVDPKGELAAITAPWRRECGDVFIVNPFQTLAALPGYEDLKSCGFNPMAGFDPDSPSFNADAGLMAEAKITMEGTQPFFPRSARNLDAVCTMMEVLEAKAQSRAPSLGRVRDMLTSPAGLPAMLAKAAASGHRGMANKAGPLMQEAKSIRDVIGEAAAQTEFLDDPEMVADLAMTGPDFSKLKSKSTTVYLILPADMMERHSKWFRLVLSAALRALMKPRLPGELPVTFILEEYFLIASGGLKIIESCMAYVRGFGIQLFPVLQDLNQLQDLYPKRWQTFLSNAGVVAHVGPPGDLTTSEWMSKRAGDTTDFTQSISENSGQSFNPDQDYNLRASMSQGGGTSYGQTRVPFLPVHDLLNTPQGNLYLWKQGLANTVLTYAPLYVDSPLGLKRRARDNPYFNG